MAVAAPVAVRPRLRKLGADRAFSFACVQLVTQFGSRSGSLPVASCALSWSEKLSPQHEPAAAVATLRAAVSAQAVSFLGQRALIEARAQARAACTSTTT